MNRQRGVLRFWRMRGLGRRIFLSSTLVEGRFFLRLNATSHRTHAGHLHDALALIRDAGRHSPR